MKVLAFIPARLESKRFPNKVLKLIYNIPMIEHVRRRAVISGVFDEVLIVTNSKIIQKKLIKYNAKTVLTKNKHFNGSSRVSEVSKNYQFDYACILFADEPFINPVKISNCIKKIKKNKKIRAFNLTTNLKINDFKSKEVVKIETDKNGFIKNYFRIPDKNQLKNKYRKSSGILIFKKNLIDNYKTLKIKKNERIHKIEQFRLIDNNIPVKSFFIKDIYPSINTKKELRYLLSLVSKDKNEIKILNKTKKIEY